MEHRNILFVRLLVVSTCASCWSCLHWECSFRDWISEAKCMNTKGEGWRREYDFGTETDYTSSHIFIFLRLIFSFHTHFLYFQWMHIHFRVWKRERMLYFRTCYLSFLVCFVTCTIFSICLNLSSMSAWISVLQSFVADRKRKTMQFRFVTLLTAIVLLQHLTVKIK